MAHRSTSSRIAGIAIAVMVCAVGLVLLSRGGLSPAPDGALPPQAREGRDAGGRLTAPPSERADAHSEPVRPEGAPARRDLARDERLGGHTLARHVGRSDTDLRERLRREARISAASTYTDRDTAETTVAAALDREASRVTAWAARQGSRPNFALDFDGDPRRPLGRSLRRGDRRARDCNDAVVVLRWDVRRNDYFVLTSYPECRR